MSQHEIVSLRCPSCGSGINEVSRDRPFGAEFRCDVCGITSVLIIDRALVPLGNLQKEGEKVCLECGRIATREARFCQEGHILVRQCVYQDCGREFGVDHQRCDFCGRLQSANWLDDAKTLLVAGDNNGAMRIVREAQEAGLQVDLWVKEMAASGLYIEAIAFAREINKGMGLKEAKDLVDSLVKHAAR